jgi:thioredoxin-like negative regulator of GroEL
MRRLVKKLLCGVGFALLCNQMGAQSLDQAKKLYNEGEYAEAKPAFEKLVKQSPGNASYNLWYGVCCYETGDLKAAEIFVLRCQTACHRGVSLHGRALLPDVPVCRGCRNV